MKVSRRAKGIKLEKTPSGHLAIPCSEFWTTWRWTKAYYVIHDHWWRGGTRGATRGRIHASKPRICDDVHRHFRHQWVHRLQRDGKLAFGSERISGAVPESGLQRARRNPRAGDGPGCGQCLRPHRPGGVQTTRRTAARAGARASIAPGAAAADAIRACGAIGPRSKDTEHQ